MHEVQELTITLCQYNTDTIHTNIHIWAHSTRLPPVTYDSVMKHKTHTVEASGAGEDGTTDKRQTGTERPNEMEKIRRRERGRKVRQDEKSGRKNLQKNGKEKAGLCVRARVRNKRKGRTTKWRDIFAHTLVTNTKRAKQNKKHTHTKGNGAGQQSDHSVHTQRGRTAGESDCERREQKEGGRQRKEQSSLLMM